MEFFRKVGAFAQQTVDRLSDSAWGCIFITFTIFTAVICSLRFIVDGLMQMHRSKTGLKKLYKNYSIGQRLLLLPGWRECLHAARFCRFLIVCHHCVGALFVLHLVLTALSGIFPVLLHFVAWYTLLFAVMVGFPTMLLGVFLDKYPFRKWRHEYTFKKYHNTDDHSSLR